MPRRNNISKILIIGSGLGPQGLKPVKFNNDPSGTAESRALTKPFLKQALVDSVYGNLEEMCQRA